MSAAGTTTDTVAGAYTPRAAVNQQREHLMSGPHSIRAAASAALIGAALLPAAFAATASAAALPVTVSMSKPCYVIRTRTHPLVVLTATGLAPGIPVAVTDTQGDVDANVTSDGAGQVVISMREPNPQLAHPGATRDTITVTGYDPSGAMYRGSTNAYFSELAVAYGSARARHGLGAFAEKVKWTFSGFTAGETIWGHYTYDGKDVARQSFGRAQGACGLLTVRRRLYPATARHSAYRLQLDDQHRYSAHTVPALHLKLALTFL
jgi:hypothetical protein